MLSPARKNNIALLNLSSQCIVFMEKCISVPHDRKTIFCFPSHEKKYFDKKMVVAQPVSHFGLIPTKCFAQLLQICNSINCLPFCYFPYLLTDVHFGRIAIHKEHIFFKQNSIKLPQPYFTGHIWCRSRVCGAISDLVVLLSLSL